MQYLLKPGKNTYRIIFNYRYILAQWWFLVFHEMEIMVGS